MNKIKIFVTTMLLSFNFIYSTLTDYNQRPVYSQTEKKSSRKKNRRKRLKSSGPLLNKQAAEKITTLDQTCQPQVLHFQIDALNEKDKLLCTFFNRLEFTHDGINAFFSHTFNKREYATEFLPHNFTHLMQFLEYGIQTNQPVDFFDGVLRLFSTKLKGTSFVNAAAFEKLLEKSSPLYEKLIPETEKSFWKDIKKLLWTNFKNQFNFLKQSPMLFFEDVSDQIVKQVKQKIATPEHFKSTLVRLTGNIIDKLAWSPEDQLATWQSFKSIGNSVQALYNKGIITDTFDCNELYWGLIERFCFFLELAGSKLTIETCKAMQEDLKNNQLQWITLEEQETGLETKLERIVQALIETEAKIRIGKEGIITELIPLKKFY